MKLSAWDRRLAARAVGLAAVTALVALLVIITTDDGATWARRAAMWGAIAPAFGAVGTLGALRLAEARGELLALAAIGARPSRARTGAVIGGIAVALAGPCVVASRWADQSALFPRPAEVRVWAPDKVTGEGTEGEGEGGGSVSPRRLPRASLREATMGIRVERGGRVTFLEETAPAVGRSREEGGARAASIMAIALCAVACPSWVAARSSAIRKTAVGLLAAFALIASFQAVAMNRGSPLLLLTAPLLLLADAFVARYRAR